MQLNKIECPSKSFSYYNRKLRLSDYKSIALAITSHEWKSTCIVLQYGIDSFLFLILLLMLFIKKTVLLAVKHTYFQEMLGIKNWQ